MTSLGQAYIACSNNSLIRSWLGQASIETTNTYVEIDPEAKRKTLVSAEKILAKP